MKIIILIVTFFASVSANANTYMKTTDILYTEESHPDEYCLALNIYHEARSDNIAGQYAVADVVLNRVADKRYPNDICSVVHEGKISQWHLKQDPPRTVMVRNKCQFSWYCDGLPDEPKLTDSWRRAQLIAYYIIQYGRMRGISEGATHYHATYVDPLWNRKLDPIGRIGEHLFFRWP